MGLGSSPTELDLLQRGEPANRRWEDKRRALAFGAAAEEKQGIGITCCYVSGRLHRVGEVQPGKRRHESGTGPCLHAQHNNDLMKCALVHGAVFCISLDTWRRLRLWRHGRETDGSMGGIPTGLPTCLPVCLPIYQSTYLPTYGTCLDLHTI